MSRRNLATALLLALFVYSPGLAAAESATSGQGGDSTDYAVRIGHEIDRQVAWGQEVQQRMQDNLSRCVELGMGDTDLEMLFPVGDGDMAADDARHWAVIQDRVIAMAVDGVPTEPMFGKMREATVKGVGPARLAPVMERTGSHVRSAHGMVDAFRNGSRGGARMDNHDATAQLARCLWDGLGEGDMVDLHNMASDHGESALHGLDGFVAACRAATGLLQAGVAHGTAVGMMKHAMREGYGPRAMLAMGTLGATDGMNDSDRHAMLGHMQQWIQDGMSVDEMSRHMMEGGWMGPSDMMGPGGHQGIDGVGMGGPGQHGGMGGSDDGHGGSGGMGGGDHGGEGR